MLSREILAILLILYMAYKYSMCVSKESPLTTLFRSMYPSCMIGTDIKLPEIPKIPVLKNPLSTYAIPTGPIDWMDSFRDEYLKINVRHLSVPDHEILTN